MKVLASAKKIELLSQKLELECRVARVLPQVEDKLAQLSIKKMQEAELSALIQQHRWSMEDKEVLLGIADKLTSQLREDEFVQSRKCSSDFEGSLEIVAEFDCAWRRLIKELDTWALQASSIIEANSSVYLEEDIKFNIEGSALNIDPLKDFTAILESYSLEYPSLHNTASELAICLRMYSNICTLQLISIRKNSHIFQVQAPSIQT